MTKSPKSFAALSNADLADLYVKELLSVPTIAERYHVPQSRVRTRLLAFGVVLRKRGPIKRWVFDEAELKDLYVTQRLKPGAISKLYGCSSTTIDRALEEFGVETGPQPLLKVVDGDTLRHLYEVDRLSLGEIAELFDTNSQKVSTALHAIGVAMPQPSPKAVKLSARKLRNLYEVKQMTLVEIASQIGSTRTLVERALKAHGVAMRPSGSRTKYDIEVSTLRQLAEHQGLNQAQIAGLYGASPATISNAFNRHQIEVKPVLQDKISAEQLRDLYETQQITMQTLATELGCSKASVSRLLVHHKIPIRPRGHRCSNAK